MITFVVSYSVSFWQIAQNQCGFILRTQTEPKRRGFSDPVMQCELELKSLLFCDRCRIVNTVLQDAPAASSLDYKSDRWGRSCVTNLPSCRAIPLQCLCACLCLRWFINISRMFWCVGFVLQSQKETKRRSDYGPVFERILMCLCGLETRLWWSELIIIKFTSVI